MILNFLIFLTFLPMLAAHFRNLWEMQQYQFFPVLLLAAVWLTLQRKIDIKEFFRFHPSSAFQYTVLVASILLYLVAVISSTPNAGYLALMGVLACHIANYHQSENPDLKSSRRNNTGSLWGIWILLLLLVRLPGTLHAKLISSLQLASSAFSSRLLDTLGINHLMTGNILHLPGSELFVDEACSGVVSLFSIIAFGAVYAVWMGYGYWRTAMLLLVSIAWTGILNILRISSIAVADVWFDLDWAHGLPHTILGLVLFSIAIFGFYCTDNILGLIHRFLREDYDTAAAIGSLGRRSTHDNADVRRNGLQPLNLEVNQKSSQPALSIPITLALLTLTTASGLWIYRIYFKNAKLDISLVERSGVLNPDTLSEIGNVQEYELIHRSENHMFGEFSSIYTFKDPRRDNSRADGFPSEKETDAVGEYYFSVDYPYRGEWHELTSCYIGSGWTVRDRKVIQTDEDDFVEVFLTKPGGQEAYFIFSLTNSQGRHVDSLDKNNFVSWTLNGWYQRSIFGGADTLLQFQLWYPHPVTEEQRLRLHQQFLLARQTATAAIFDASL